MAASQRVTATRVRRRPTRAGVVLDPDLIIDAALRLIEAPGGNALTVRRLGVELGADPTAVYRYFRDLDTLLIAITDRLIGEALDGFAPAADWTASLREMGEQVHRLLQRHPRMALLMASRFTAGPNELRAADLGIGLLLEAGFSAPDAVRHYRDFIETVLAIAAIDVTELTPAQQQAEDEALARAFGDLSAAEYPHLSAVSEHLMAVAASPFPGVLDKLIEAMRVSLHRAATDG
ncbi:TetR/AcrR family transcriptional regulator [Actinoplanes sp. NPDC024001]|uniref:TetR/AcrR family transcriptional regulator n=1 Tax=Actinoplanes sp. NPDC024001 TaxID=3154598 RepID=UPI0033E7AA1A